MAVQIGSYSHDHFESLPSLNDARAKFVAVDGDHLVDSCFKDLFIKHEMQHTYGLTMMHRHCNIDPGEKMVSYNGTTCPWPDDPKKGMNALQPIIWGFSSPGVISPLEFQYTKNSKLHVNGKQLDFIARFEDLLTEKRLTNLFGLCPYPGDDFNGTCEITMGRTNINLMPADYPEGLQQTPTAWFFSESLWQRGCRCVCDNRHDPHGHGAHVYTQSG